jgi:hypothetical protein
LYYFSTMVSIAELSKVIERARKLVFGLLLDAAPLPNAHIEDAPPVQAQFPSSDPLQTRSRCERCGSARLEWVDYSPKTDVRRSQWTFRCAVCGWTKQLISPAD